ncbi:DUF7311 family protein [Haloglomus litoreum]|uniref:DUF7311 family protein n=1 Tax=Haloglomus litoreum TaxID=3034026 RepID=UPI0023E8FC21|nr:hypothetical protein [Haloglomus sp. DT116]
MTGALRVVLAVLLTAALLGTGLPAAERAGETRTATRLDGTAARLATAAARLAARNDPTRSGAARRTIRLRVPPDGRLRIGHDTLAWRVDDGAWHRQRPSPDLVAEHGRLTLAPGHHRLRLSLRLRYGTAVVGVTPLPGD